ncbi:hypothetical protein [Sediminihabitans luteus]|nr:hypothetical protein [Sediminihabitans luteus]
MTSTLPPRSSDPVPPSVPETVSVWRWSGPVGVRGDVDALRSLLDDAARSLAGTRIESWAGFAAQAYRRRLDALDAALAQAERLVGVAQCEADRLARLLDDAATEHHYLYAEATA